MKRSSQHDGDTIHLGVDLLAHASPYRAARKWAGQRSYWLCQLFGWGGLFVLLVAPLPLKARISMAELYCHGAFVLSGVVISHLLRVYLIHALEKSLQTRGLAVRAAAGLILSVFTHVVVQAHLTQGFAPGLNTPSAGTQEHAGFLFDFADNISFSAGIFIVWMGAYFGLLTYRHYQAVRMERLQLAADVQEAAWKALQAQLNPHLLFNSLNCIRALIPREQTAPREALTHLSELLRSSLSLRQSELIPLAREMETVDSFLALESLRFETRLRLSRSIDPVCLSWDVPPFLVQTLMENAVKYGVAPYEDGGDITLDIRPEGQVLRIEIVNRGRINEVAAETSTGLGLRNLRSRLALLFGPAASLILENCDRGRVRALAQLPRQSRPGMEKDHS